ncbi:hypothetical protein MNBD_ALPHA11-296 [hydrothermal vent metagenome]|uniref:Uncharacterized protein n=1 Tax=hydrothermal vent metagenome TaxID=652676 RepID=A0A3B0UB12_9ZZZZ
MSQLEYRAFRCLIKASGFNSCPQACFIRSGVESLEPCCQIFLLRQSLMAE